MPRVRPLFTIGHSTRTFDELVEVLRPRSIEVLVDIRTLRRSRTNPQFNEDTFGPALADMNIRYLPLAVLGGLRGKAKGAGPSRNDAWEVAAFRNYADYAETPPFREGLAELLSVAARERTVIMCAEAVWWRCHRRIVTDYVLARGVPVVHVFTKTHEEPATLTPFAVVGDDGTIRYPRSR
jgi:uncharacterized protein (DUF488 family)